MKTRILLVVSCLANAGLLGAYWLSQRPNPAAPADQAVTEVASPRARVGTELRPSRVVVALSTNDFQWANVESEEYKTYIANLRAIGCPEETIRDIIIADVNKLYAGRVAGLYPTPKDFKFWRVEDRALRGEERAREQKRRELEREKRNLIKELLGIDYEQEVAKFSGRPDDDSYRYGFLSPEKQEQLKALQDKYRDLERGLGTEGGGRDPENRAKVAALRAQQQAEMAQLLGPQDYEEYQLRNSWTSRNMRENLTSFQPTEEEFREIFKVRKAYDDQFGFNRDGGDASAREQRRLAQQQLEEQMKATLGEQRYHDYQLAQDDRYREIYDYAQRNNLPEGTADAVYDMRKTAEDARRKLEADKTLTADQRSQALQGIYEETKRSLTETLGGAAPDYLRRDGRWLNQMARTETSPQFGGRGNFGGGRGGGRGNDGGGRDRRQ